MPPILKPGSYNQTPASKAGAPRMAPSYPDTPQGQVHSWFDRVISTLNQVELLPLIGLGDVVQSTLPSDNTSGDFAANLISPLAMLEKPAAKVVAKAAGSLAELGGKRVPNPLKAYHGSPHDFDQFSLSKIGTGEGAQAYGHGLYFAENEGVAAEYRKQLSRKLDSDPKYWDGKTLPNDLIQPDEMRELGELGQKMRKLGNLPAEEMARWRVLHDKREAYMEAVDAARPKGATYEVNLHVTPDELLDWDKPLSEQPQKVREALQSIMGDVQPVKLKDGAYSVTRVGKDGSGLVVREISEATPEAAREAYARFVMQGQGADAYREVARAKATSGAFPEILVPRPNQASDALKQAGIKGIQCLDQGSRSAADSYEATKRLVEKMKAGGHMERAAEMQAKLDKMQPPTRNFVIFDDELIEIAKKYGIPLAALTAEWKAKGGTVESRGDH